MTDIAPTCYHGYAEHSESLLDAPAFADRHLLLCCCCILTCRKGDGGILVLEDLTKNKFALFDKTKAS